MEPEFEELVLQDLADIKTNFVLLLYSLAIIFGLTLLGYAGGC